MEEEEKPIEQAREPIVDDKNTVIVEMPLSEINQKRQTLIKGILKEKSIKVEEKRKELIDSGNINEVGLQAILTRDDYEYYQEKKNQYLTSYPELTDPFDQNTLHLMLIEEIFLRNLLKRKKKHPNADIRDDYNDCVKRIDTYMKSLSVRRADRNKGKQKKQVLNIANLSINFAEKDRFDAMLERVNQNLIEEDAEFKDSNKIEE